MAVRVQRDKSCDQTYQAFLEDLPSLRDAQGNDMVMEKIVFVERFKELKVSPEQRLKCYRLLEFHRETVR